MWNVKETSNSSEGRTVTSRHRRLASASVVGLSLRRVLAVTFLAWSYRSDALASSSSRSTSFAGKSLSFLPRGGASEASSSSTGREELRCVMDLPRLRNHNGVSKENGHHRNGQEQLPHAANGVANGIARNGASSSDHASLAGSSSTGWVSDHRGGAIPALKLKNGKNSGPRMEEPSYAEYVAETKLPTDIGKFQLRAYRVPGAPVGLEPCVIYSRDKPPFGSTDSPALHVPVRIHDQCITSEVFGSQRCDCKEQLHIALRYIKKHGGCIIYLQQEGRGIGLANKIAAYALQDVGLDTVDANLHLGFPEDIREYGIVPTILHDMRIGSVQLMTNNPRKVERLSALGVKVDRTLPVVVDAANPYNRKYLETKRNRMHHDNFAQLLARKDVTLKQGNNGVMAPLRNGSKGRKYIPKEYINNGTEIAANAVHVSLLVEEEEATLEKEEAGVKAHGDGYCFGRQSVIDAIEAIGRGEMVVVVDDMDRENEGDFIMAADQCTELDMARIIRYSSGVVCLAMEGDRMDELQLPPMVTNNEDPKGTAFTVSVDATKEHGITTGISATDRSKTVQLLARNGARPSDFHRPGHIFPLRAAPGGVLERDGHTEASVDLARLAGRSPAGVLCEIVSEENPVEMMRLPELRRFCKKHSLVLTSIVDLAQYRRETGL